MKHITILVDENCNFIHGYSNENESPFDIQRIYDNLLRLGYIKTDYNKPTEIELYDTGGKYNDIPVYEITFSHDGEPDYGYVPSITMTEYMKEQLGM